MEIILDAGNSYIKCFVFENSAISKNTKFEYKDIPLLISFCNSHNAPIIISDVSGKITNEVLNQFQNSYFLYNSSSNLPIKINYDTKQTLGFDRIASAIGAEKLLPQTNKLIIDFGTAITIDFVSKDMAFEGGNISPGLTTRFKSLHDYTGKLPLLTANNSTKLYGKTTEEAIQSGVINGIVFEIERYIENYKAIFSNISVFLCGGDAIYFEKMLKKTIFAKPNLLAIGLHTIYKYNVKKNS